MTRRLTTLWQQLSILLETLADKTFVPHTLAQFDQTEQSLSRNPSRTTWPIVRRNRKHCTDIGKQNLLFYCSSESKFYSDGRVIGFEVLKLFGGRRTAKSTKPLLTNQERCLLLFLTVDLPFLPPPRWTRTKFWGSGYCIGVINHWRTNSSVEIINQMLNRWFGRRFSLEIKFVWLTPLKNLIKHQWHHQQSENNDLRRVASCLITDSVVLCCLTYMTCLSSGGSCNVVKVDSILIYVKRSIFRRFSANPW